MQETDQQQRDRSYQLAQIQTKIASVKGQLSLVSVVTSPYSGTIKSIKVQKKQTNNSLLVEISLAVDINTAVSNSGSDAPAPKNAPSSQG